MARINSLQVYRLARIPTTRVRDTFVLKSDAHHYARGELDRLATVLEAQEARYKEKRKARLSGR